jgi:filamentous hemagglutinin family protein
MMKKIFNFKSIVSLLVLSGCIATTKVFGLPDSPTVISGSLGFDYSTRGELTITTSSALSIVEWNSFSIDDSELTTITFSDSSSVILAHVTGESVSNILGTLQSNGGVYLVNPNGIIIGTNGIIDANSFLGSTLDVLIW